MKRSTYIAAVVAVAGLALAGCSSSKGGSTTNSSSSGGGSSSSSSAPAPTFKGEIKIGMIGDTTVVSAVGNPEPERLSAMNAHFDAVNATGGINGYKLVLDFCDEKGDPNIATTCARKFVADKVVAEVSTLSVFGQKYNPVLQAAGIDRIGPLVASVAEYTSPNNFLLSGGAISMYEGAILQAAQNGAKSFYLLGTATEGSDSLIGLLKPVAGKAGLKWAGNAFIPPGTPDVSSYVTAAQKSGADVVLLTFGPDGTQQVLKTAVQLGATFRVASAAESFSPEVISSVGADKKIITDALLVTPNPPLTSTDIPAVKQYLAEMDAREKSGDKNAASDKRSHVFDAWLGALAFTQVMKNVTTEITNKTVDDTFKAATDVDMLGAFPAWTPNKTAVPLLPRISNPYAWYVKVVGGKQVLAQPQAINVLGG
jgi:ABC-type branched-subunit amino acid transport system substrate-binding protein